MARKLGFMALLAWVALVSTAMPVVAQKGGNPNPGVIPWNRQYVDLAVQMFKWTLAMPVHDPDNPSLIYHPMFSDIANDPLGQTVMHGQPETGNVIFLGGALYGIDPITGGMIGQYGPVVRNVTIPTGKRIFFPIINAEVDNAWNPPGTATDEELREFLAWFMSPYDMDTYYATVDGKSITNLDAYRTVTPKFTYTLPAWDDLYLYLYPPGADPTGIGLYNWDAFGDGWYLLLAPLAPGEHVLRFGGGADGLMDITYHITVLPPGKK